MTTILIIILAGLAIVALLNGFDQFAILAATAAGFTLANHFWSVSPGWATLFWIIWIIALVVAFLMVYRPGMWAATVALIAAAAIVLLAGVSPSFAVHTEDDTVATNVVSSTNPVSGEEEEQHIEVDANNADEPVSGEDAVRTDTIDVTLDCDPDITLRECIEQSGEQGQQAEKAFEAAGVNVDSTDEVYHYVIVLNSPGTNADTARSMVASYLGETGVTADVLYFDGVAVQNSYTDKSGDVRFYWDARSQVRPLVVQAPSKAAADAAAKKVNGRFQDCLNAVRGIAPKPQPIPKTEPPKEEPPKEEPPCPVNPDLPKGHPDCKDPENDRIKDEGVNPAPAPETPAEDTPPIEETPAPPPSEEGGAPGDEVIDLPADGVEPGTGEEPRTEENIPDVPADVPANEDESPLEGDFDPDAGSNADSDSLMSSEDANEAGAGLAALLLALALAGKRKRIS